MKDVEWVSLAIGGLFVMLIVLAVIEDAGTPDRKECRGLYSLTATRAESLAIARDGCAYILEEARRAPKGESDND